MPDEYDSLTPEELERILRERAGGVSEDSEINVLPTPVGPTGELYQTLLEQIPAITFMTSFEPGKQNVYVSPQIKEILGYTPEEWLGRPSLWQERLHPEDKDRFQDEFSKTVMSRGTAVNSVYRFLHRDGRIVWIQGDVRIKRDEKSGFPLFVQAVGFDVTKIEEAKERELAVREKRIKRLQSEVEREFGPDQLVGSSKRMQELRNLIGKVARSDASALITGESGTGKELVARALHYSGRRKDKPFVAVNCAAFTETLLESELFGVEGGKITNAREHRGKFEQAHGGTLLLDEIGDMLPLLQSKILRALQERKIQRVMGSKDIDVDVRVIAATHKDLPALIKDGKFRADLYFRLKVVVLEVPHLRERASDIPELVENFLARANRVEKREVVISDAAMHFLKTFAWAENNVRELQHAIEGAVVICDGDTILPDHLPPSVAGRRPEPQPQTTRVKYHEAVESVERRLIVQALEESKGVKAEAARSLSLLVGTLTNRMTYFGIVALQEPPWVKAP